MQGLDVLLLDGLLGDEGNLGLARGRTDRLGVIAVVLLSADEWLHILRADDLHLMTQFLALARPIEGARTGFDDHCARIDLCEGCEKLITHHPALQDDVAAAIDAMTVASLILGGRDWNAGCGNDRQDTPGVFRFDVTASPLER